MTVKVESTGNQIPGLFYKFVADPSDTHKCLCCEGKIRDGDDVYMCEACGRFEHRRCIAKKLRPMMHKALFMCHEEYQKCRGRYVKPTNPKYVSEPIAQEVEI